MRLSLLPSLFTLVAALCLSVITFGQTQKSQPWLKRRPPFFSFANMARQKA